MAKPGAERQIKRAVAKFCSSIALLVVLAPYFYSLATGCGVTPWLNQWGKLTGRVFRVRATGIGRHFTLVGVNDKHYTAIYR